MPLRSLVRVKDDLFSGDMLNKSRDQLPRNKTPYLRMFKEIIRTLLVELNNDGNSNSTNSLPLRGKRLYLLYASKELGSSKR